MSPSDIAKRPSYPVNIPLDVMKYLVKIGEALTPIKEAQTSVGEIYIEKVTIAYEGETWERISVQVDEHGELTVQIETD